MALGDMVPAAVTLERQPVPTFRACQGQSGWEGMWLISLSDAVLLFLWAEGNCQIENPAEYRLSLTPKLTKPEATQGLPRSEQKGTGEPRYLH